MFSLMFSLALAWALGGQCLDCLGIFMRQRKDLFSRGSGSLLATYGQVKGAACFHGGGAGPVEEGRGRAALTGSSGSAERFVRAGAAGVSSATHRGCSHQSAPGALEYRPRP
ncbi:MAG: hypothetical protein CFE41_16330 [Burkholderiales bacterium PBB2]|nr:MAG: hypothetical protein CFE41_16330 [Burkholderiales bacterium PBB2]